MGRLLVAHALRLIVVLSLALAIVIALLTTVSVALAATGHLDLAGGYGLADILLMSSVVVGFALAMSRLAHLALRRVVDLGPHARPRA